MFNVLIVDDEPSIREGLKTIIEWEKYGFKVIDTAANGRDALLKFNQLRPDLTIIDIRMPGMTGLEVIEQVRLEHGEGRFLILSGYADFDYAKRAISYSVDAYLLKPVDEDELIEELQRIHISLSKQVELKLRNAEEDHYYRAHMVEEFLFHDSEHGNIESVVNLGLSWNSYQIILIEVHGQAIGESLYINALKGRLIEHFDETEHGIVFSAGSNLGILLTDVIDREDQAIRLYAELSEMMEECNGLVYAAAGPMVKEIGEIGISYSGATELLQHRFLFEHKRIMTTDDLQTMISHFGNKPDVSQSDEIELSDKLYYALDIGSKDALWRVMEEIEQRIVSIGRSEQSMKSLYAQIFASAINKLSNSKTERNPILQQYSSFITEVYQQVTLKDLRQLTIDHLSRLVEGLGGMSKDTVLKQMIDFIQRNYNENLKLELLAEVFNYNSAYLGKLFKNYTGEQFNTFLDKVRIEKAKDLLLEGFMVHQVASRVGYANVDYFHSKFKRYVGISPSSYRVMEKD
ncbi:response regulator transcription factor [Paenibacillus sp. FA6]|uniref:response regulator transcription factor n=1 Tax=Paenibacillus sp. FA6 TaxID=3413029 RepID=UPI003F658D6D